MSRGTDDKLAIICFILFVFSFMCRDTAHFPVCLAPHEIGDFVDASVSLSQDLRAMRVAIPGGSNRRLPTILLLAVRKFIEHTVTPFNLPDESEFRVSF